MKEGYNKKNIDFRESDIVFSKSIKAGKRIYYFDVKINRRGELFLAITESKKVTVENKDEQIMYDKFDKHKIFLYKEDFDRFIESLDQTISYIKENNTVDFVPKVDNDPEFPEKTENIELLDKKFNIKIDI